MRCLFYFLPLVLLISCSPGTDDSAGRKQYSVEELASRKAADSSIQDYFSKHLNKEPINSLIAARDSVFEENCAWIRAVFLAQGLPEVQQVGHKGVHDFWIMVQHCDVDPEFQDQVLIAMRADTIYAQADYHKEMAYLTDRVLKNAGRPQRYGTQLDQRNDFTLALPDLEDSCGVDALRLAVGMEPIAVYYNNYLQWHFSANGAHYDARGLIEPLAFAMPDACAPPYAILRAELEDMYLSDQGIRERVATMTSFDGTIVAEMNRTDSLNQLRLGQFLAAYGWLPRSKIGDQAADGIFYVIQHGPVEVMEQYLEDLQGLASQREADPTHAALMEDRILMYRGKRQRFGTQARSRLTADGQTEYYIWPIEDIEMVNERRAAAGFEQSVEENAARLQAVYDPQEKLPRKN